MKIQKKSKSFIPLFYWFCFILIHFNVLASEYSTVLPLSKGKHLLYSEFNSNYYYTNTNYISFAQTQFLNKNNRAWGYFHYTNLDFSMGYTFSSWFEADIFFNGILFAESKNRTQTRITYPNLYSSGMSFRIQNKLSKSIGIIPEFSFSIPFFWLRYDNDTEAITTNNNIHLTPSVWLYGIIHDTLYPFLYFSFQWQQQYSWQQYSALLQSKAGLMLKTDIAEIGFSVYSLFPVIPNNMNQERSNSIKNANAGSLKIASINPIVISFFTWASWHFPYVTFRVSGDVDIIGYNYAKGYSVLASLIFTFSPIKSKVQTIFPED